MLLDNPAISTAEKLRDRFAGSVVTAADAGYDQARGAFNLLADQRPAAVATPCTVAETAAIVTAVRDAGLKIAPQGSSHNVLPLGAGEDTVLLKLARMTGVE